MAKTLLAMKLRILTGKKVLILIAPPNYLTALGELPKEVILEHTPDGLYNIVH